MNTPNSICSSIRFFALIIALQSSESGDLKAEPTNSYPPNGYKWAKPVWGAESNDWSAALSVSFIIDHFQVQVTIRRMTNPPDLMAPENIDELYTFGPRFLAPTNGFVGQLELRGPDGAEVPMTKPDVVSLQAYPDSLSWTALTRGADKGPPVRIPGYDRGPFAGNDLIQQARLGFFNLSRYFDLEKPGDYKLTVWPKIYKKVQRDKDIFRRIDIPPVSFTFHWDGSDLSQTPP